MAKLSAGRMPTPAPDREGGALRLPVTYRGVVYPWHIDQIGHMNVQHYVGMFDQATWALMGLIGLTPSYFRENGRGMAALEQTIAYKRELHAGDLVEIRSAILALRAKTIRFCHEMHRSETGELAARTELVGAFMDTVARKSLPLPAGVAARAEAYRIAAQAGDAEARAQAL